MYFVCTIHPDLEETRREGYRGWWMTLTEKKEAIERFYDEKQVIPLSLDHTASKTYGSSIPVPSRVGKVLDLFLDKSGDMAAKCILETDNEAFKRVNTGSHIHGEKWGVSPRIDWSMPDGIEGDRIEKRLTHVALTLDPHFASQGAYIHQWHHREAGVDRIIARHYAGESTFYAAPALLDKLKGTNLIVFRFLFHHALLTLFRLY